MKILFPLLVINVMLGATALLSAASEFQWNQLEPVNISTASLSPPGTVVLATPAGPPSDTAFLQLQAHLPPDQRADLTISLSTRPDFHPMYTTTGRQTGLVSLNASITSWYIRAENLTWETVTVWILFAAKSWEEPLPGGCDLTSPVPNPPVLSASHLIADGIAWRLSYALAGEFREAKRVKESCNDSLMRGNLRYRLYALTLKSSSLNDWLIGLRRMTTGQQAIVYGRQIAIDGEDERMPKYTKFDVGARPGAPVIYTVVVERTDTGQFSAYVPVTLDECRRSTGFECVVATTFEWRVVTTVAAILGLYFCTIAFRCFSLSVLLCGLSAGALFTLPGTLRALPTESVWLAYLLGAGVGGLVIGIAALIIWVRCRSTGLGLLFIHLPGSYLLTCAAFASPLGQLWWIMREEYIMFMSLAVIVLLSLLLLLLFTNAGGIFSLSLLGAFVVCLCVSANLLEGSVFPYIFLDLFRRTAYKDYNKVHLAFELRHSVDWILLVSLLAAVPVCCLLQYCCNRGSLDPASRANHRRRTRLDRDTSESFGYAPNESTNVSAGANERTPLLVSGGRAEVNRHRVSPPPYSAA